MNLKTIRFKIIAFALCAFSANNVHAQPWVLRNPSNSDNFIYNTANDVSFVNCAMIKYDLGGGNYGRLSAIVEDGNLNAGKINIFDDGPGGTFWQIDQSTVAPGYGAARQDVIIGNDPGNPHNDYWVAVAYEPWSVPNNVFIDYYLVHYTGSYTFTVNYMGNTTINGAYHPHLDVIADATNPAPTGLPFCDHFVVTWDDHTGNVFAQMASISSAPTVMSGGSAVLITNNGKSPDVAAVTQASGSGVDEVALVTYVDNGIGVNKLFCTSYNFSTTASSTAMLDNGSVLAGAISIKEPRIDARDYTQIPSFWTTSGFSHYKVVAEVNDGTRTEVRTYDDNMPLPYYWESSQVVDAGPLGYPSGPYNHFSPCVAAHEDLIIDEPAYVIAHGTNLNYINHVSLFSEPVNLINPNDLCTNWTGSLDYFRVNYTIMPLINPGMQLPNGISSTQNMIDDGEVLHAWGNFVAPTGAPSYDIYYKLSTPSFPVSHYNYKTAQSGTKNAANIGVGLAVYPNPAADDITISAKSEADQYRITDISGRIVKNGTLKGGDKTTISIKDLVPGAYVLNIFSRNANVDHATFVKK